jgi:hypothetical protein
VAAYSALFHISHLPHWIRIHSNSILIRYKPNHPKASHEHYSCTKKGTFAVIYRDYLRRSVNSFPCNHGYLSGLPLPLLRRCQHPRNTF